MEISTTTTTAFTTTTTTTTNNNNTTTTTSNNNTNNIKGERKAFGSCQKTKKVMEHESNGNTYYNWCVRKSRQTLDQETGSV